MKGKKTGGRTKGTPNKVNATTRDIIAHMTTNYYASGQLQDDLAQLQPVERVNAMVRLLGLITTKTHDINFNPGDTVQSILAEIAGLNN